MTKTVRILALHTFQEHWRNRSFVVALIFSGILLYMSMLLGVLAVDQEVRVLLDFGLSFIELMALGLAIFGAASGVLREMETKTIYLVLSRPVPRAIFLLGRYLGLLLSTGGAVLIMAAIHLSLLWIKGWAWNPGYLLALFGILLKLAISIAMAMLTALLSTSVLSALSITSIAWTLGHFIPEIGFLIRRSSHAGSALILQAVTLLLPNLQLMNFRDRLDVPTAALATGGSVLSATGYALLYCAACLALAHALFRRKEF